DQRAPQRLQLGVETLDLGARLQLERGRLGLERDARQRRFVAGADAAERERALRQPDRVALDRRERAAELAAVERDGPERVLRRVEQRPQPLVRDARRRARVTGEPRPAPLAPAEPD